MSLQCLALLSREVWVKELNWMNNITNRKKEISAVTQVSSVNQRIRVGKPEYGLLWHKQLPTMISGCVAPLLWDNCGQTWQISDFTTVALIVVGRRKIWAFFSYLEVMIYCGAAFLFPPPSIKNTEHLIFSGYFLRSCHCKAKRSTFPWIVMSNIPRVCDLFRKQPRG